MRSAALLCGALLASGCQTIKVQGVEISPQTQAASAVLLVAGGLAIAHFASDETATKPDCKTFASSPDEKGATGFCAIPLD